MKQSTFVGSALALAVGIWALMASAAPRCYPTERFVVTNGGLVRDTLTGLVWQQSTGASNMIWSNARSHCLSLGAGFRLPTIKELYSLVDLSVVSGPKINQMAFPEVMDVAYWTSSPRVDVLDNFWTVSFSYGETRAMVESALRYVICVR